MTCMHCREMEVEAAEAALRQAYPEAQHVEVVGFASSTQRSSYPKGCLVRPWAAWLTVMLVVMLLSTHQSHVCCLPAGAHPRMQHSMMCYDDERLPVLCCGLC
jgi:hypothetical protein